MMPEAVMIFAAGFGTRMMPLTANKPKPMVSLDGRPMIDRAIDLAKTAGATRIVSNTHYKAEVLEQHLKGGLVRTIREEPVILDTGGGLKNAAQLLGSGHVWTMNCDAIWGSENPLTCVAKHWEPSKMDALVLCVDPAKATGTQSPGDFAIHENGTVSRGPGFIYGGVQIINMNVLDDIPDKVFSLNVAWDILIEAGRCHACIYPGQWCDVGSPEGLALAEGMLAQSDDI